MALLENRNIWATCVLAQLCRRGTWTEMGMLEGGTDLTQEALVILLNTLKAEGCVEACEWPAHGRITTHYRVTDFGQCLAQTCIVQWERDRARIDRLLLGLGSESALSL